MARFYVDHDVSLETARLLQHHNHDVVTVRDMHVADARDDEHLLRAAQQRRILISHNRRDYLMLHDAWRHWTTSWNVAHPHGGILVIPQQHWTFEGAANEIHRFVGAGHDWTNAFYEYEWRSGAGWTRRA